MKYDLSDCSDWVYRKGLTNRDSEDISEYSGKPKMLKAFCDSDQCRRGAYPMKEMKGLSKQVSMCPDCGYAIFWQWKFIRARKDR